ARVRLRGRRGSSRLPKLRREVEPELGALASNAPEPDAPVHELGEALADDESDSRPLDRSRLLSRALERLKQLVLLVLRDADARVRHRNPNAPVGLARHAHRHGTARAVVLD